MFHKFLLLATLKVLPVANEVFASFAFFVAFEMYHFLWLVFALLQSN